WMQSTGQTSTQESSLMQLPVMTYVMGHSLQTLESRAQFGGNARAVQRDARGERPEKEEQHRRSGLGVHERAVDRQSRGGDRAADPQPARQRAGTESQHG